MLRSYKHCQKTGVRKGPGRVSAKNVLAQRMPDKLFQTKWNNPVKPDRRRNVSYLFLCVF